MRGKLLMLIKRALIFKPPVKFSFYFSYKNAVEWELFDFNFHWHKYFVKEINIEVALLNLT